MTQLLLIRHGATNNNLLKPPRLQGQCADDPLSHEGRLQAEATSRFLAGREVDAVFSSPLIRARQTSAAIAAAHGLEMQIAPDLIEVDVGDWEGQSWSHIEQAEPEAYQSFISDPARFGYRGGENLLEVEQRVAPAFHRLMSENPGRRIVVVAHNVVNRVYLGRLLGVPAAEWRSIPQDNCCLNVVRFRDGKAKVVTLNSIWHL